MAKMMIVLSRDEVMQSINYPLICTTMSSAVWETGRRRRLWAEAFTESERRACYELRNKAHSWYLKKGVPDEVTMALSTLGLWQRLAAFCASL